MKHVVFFLLAACALLPGVAQGQQASAEYVRGRIVEVVDSQERPIPGSQTEALYQELRIQILEGAQAGDVVHLETDFPGIEEGDTVYLNAFTSPQGEVLYDVAGIDRRIPIFILMGLFIGAVILFGGWQGARSLLALVASFLVLVYVLVPGLLAGWNPLVASALVAGVVLFGAIFLTHGFTRQSVAAYGGTMLAIALTGLLAHLAVSATRLSGFASEEAVFLNFNTQGSLDFVGLLLGAIIIGALGVLDDIAITQAAVVRELHESNAALRARELYLRALRVGREHIGALVNTLALAYTGAALPLLLLFSTSSYQLDAVLSMEVVATEIVRIVIGSIGLIMTVPLVTALAVWLIGRKRA